MQSRGRTLFFSCYRVMTSSLRFLIIIKKSRGRISTLMILGFFGDYLLDLNSTVAKAFSHLTVDVSFTFNKADLISAVGVLMPASIAR